MEHLTHTTVRSTLRTHSALDPILSDRLRQLLTDEAAKGHMIISIAMTLGLRAGEIRRLRLPDLLSEMSDADQEEVENELSEE